MNYLLCLLLLLFANAVAAQKTEQGVYELYASQFKDLLAKRGAPDRTLFLLLKKYEENKINSNEDFAKVLGNLYPDNSGIGILLFVYDGTVLHRIFFTPGRVVEEKGMKISKAKLATMMDNMHLALNLEIKSLNRSPRLRGVEIKNAKTIKNKKVSLDTISKEFKELLIPEAFNESYKQLIIIPALNLGSFPFHLLKPYTDNTYLIERCSFTISSGLIDLIAKRSKMLSKVYDRGEWQNGKFFTTNGENRNKDATLELKWTMGSPIFISNPSYPTNLPYIFPDLPGAKKEIDSALKYVTKHFLFQGKQAVKDSILKHWNEADLLYFATHGVSSSNNPMDDSYLVLSGDDPKLTAREIMNMGTKGYKMPEMVILSACQTGLGGTLDAGITGIARSFIIAGSDQVVMSLWNVDDNSTAYLMNRFLYHIQKEDTKFFPSEPLRLAILDTKKKYPNPLNWASFSVFGLSY